MRAGEDSADALPRRHERWHKSRDDQHGHCIFLLLQQIFSIACAQPLLRIVCQPAPERPLRRARCLRAKPRRYSVGAEAVAMRTGDNKPWPARLHFP
ncbi:hypothetical protein GWL_02710 [Herbaspirillum sp. GW103]|nr:hypothetical protein GWL_02710 [Herbaspirillum sp. GW103]